MLSGCMTQDIIHIISMLDLKLSVNALSIAIVRSHFMGYSSCNKVEM